jgi:hypothetical protein
MLVWMVSRQFPPRDDVPTLVRRGSMYAATAGSAAGRFSARFLENSIQSHPNLGFKNEMR